MRAPLLPRRRPRRPSARERRVGQLLLVLLAANAGLFLLAGTRAGPPGLPPPAAPGTRSPLPLTTPAGWPRGEVERYDAASLFEKIDGKADAYLAFDFESLRFASYARPDDPAVFADAYLYDMGEPLHAYGIYRAQRSGREESLAAGEEACAAGAAVFVRKGRYYLEVAGSGPAAAAEARSLAAAIAAALPAPREPVADPAFLPREGLKSVRYVRQDCLMVEALTDAFLASYAGGTQLVVARPGSPEAARREAEEVFAFLKAPARFVVAGEYVVGVVRAADPARGEALLAEVVRRLEAGK